MCELGQMELPSKFSFSTVRLVTYYLFSINDEVFANRIFLLSSKLLSKVSKNRGSSHTAQKEVVRLTWLSVIDQTFLCCIELYA